MVADRSVPDDVNLTATPLYHMGGLFMATTYTYLGCTNVILPIFDAGEVQQAIAREKATVCLLIPTMLNMVLHHEESVPWIAGAQEFATKATKKVLFLDVYLVLLDELDASCKR